MATPSGSHPASPSPATSSGDRLLSLLALAWRRIGYRSIRTRISLIPMVALSLYLIGAAVNLFNSSSVFDAIALIRAANLPALDLIREIRSDVKAAKANVFEAISTATGLDDLPMADFQLMISAVDRSLVALEQVPSQVDKAAELRKLVNVFAESATIYVKANVGASRIEANEQMRLATDYRLASDALEVAIELSMNELEQQLQENLQKSEAAVKLTRDATTGIAAVATILLAGLSLLLIASVSASLDRILRRVRDMASGEADLTQTIRLRGKDELTEIAEAMNEFIRKLRGLIQEVALATHEIRFASAEMLTGSQNLSGVSRSQAETAQRIVESIMRASGEIGAMSRSAANALASAKQASMHAVNGGYTMSGAISDMGASNNAVRSAAEMILELQRESVRIEGVTETITAIARRSKLLAFNAAIEAASAGEQGAGFAVVADEVRLLAERSIESAVQISSILRTVNERISASVQTIENGRLAAQGGYAQSIQAQAAFDEITASVREANQTIGEIARSASSQATVAGELASNSELVLSMSQKTLSETQLTEARCQSLGHAVTRLNEIVRNFKT